MSETLEVRSGVKSRDTLKAKRAGAALALRIEFETGVALLDASDQ